MIDFQS